MAQESNAPRLVSNAAVHSFYSRLQARRSHSSTRSATTECLHHSKNLTSAADPHVPETLDACTTAVDRDRLDQEGSMPPINPTEPEVGLPVKNQTSKETAATVHQDLSSYSNNNKKSSQPTRFTDSKIKAKSIPLKEFRAIKKKLRKRELRRQNAIEACRIRAIETAQKPK
ncbi:hypothetical protein BGZ47_005793 [Haplosporangium gracile]|nr:hypothetical protein BGZ47_005793 [Haplosporangium gracile]